MVAGELRKCPYSSDGVWFVNDQEWKVRPRTEEACHGGLRSNPKTVLAFLTRINLQQVGERYELQKLLGHGSFSSVCLAIDTFTGDKVPPPVRPCLHADVTLALQDKLIGSPHAWEGRHG